jgi:tetratricopeptide (TPR) repeat protein
LTLQKAKDYDQALKSFKRMLQVSWAVNKISSETKAYDMIAKMFYYLGNAQKAAHYHKRALEGLVELTGSRTRQLSLI